MTRRGDLSENQLFNLVPLFRPYCLRYILNDMYKLCRGGRFARPNELSCRCSFLFSQIVAQLLLICTLIRSNYLVKISRGDVSSRVRQSILSSRSSLSWRLTRDEKEDLGKGNHFSWLLQSLYTQSISTGQDGVVQCMNSHHVAVRVRCVLYLSALNVLSHR